MFTGIIQEVGTVVSLERLCIEANKNVNTSPDVSANNDMRIEISCRMSIEAKHGSSISVNGVCLTVAEKTDQGFEADISSDTLSTTNLSTFDVGQKVNLEQGLLASERFDGHVVTGHVDGIGTITSLTNQKTGSRRIFVAVPELLMDNIVLKGSITLDGVSLTVMSIEDNIIAITLIPTTLQKTTMGSLKVGDTINIECDYFGKYVLSYMKSLQEELDRNNAKT